MSLKYFFIPALFLIVQTTVYSQDTLLNKAKKRLSSIFEEDKQKPKVLLLGVFHFAGEQVDANTTPVNLRVNMLSPERQKQISQLVNSLIQFRPTKIVIEASPQKQAYWDSLYHSYNTGKPIVGKYRNEADETIQLAFKLAKLMKLEKVYPVDAQPFRFKLSHADSILTYEKYKDQSDASLTYWDNKYDEESLHEDSLKFNLPLQKFLLYLNSPEKEARSIGRWLITTKRGTNSEPIGADGFIVRYFNRNVRIYSNVQRIVTSNNDRILVIYGATHMYMLKQLFSASPEFDLKDITSYLK